MALVDTHCHLDLYPDYSKVLDEVEHAHIYTIAVTNTPSVFSRCREIVQNTRFIRVALGLHPELAHARENELNLFAELLPSTRYVGEVGLDYVTQDAANRTAQRRVFQSILDQCAAAGDKVLSVHSRRAASEVISMVGDAYPGAVILHWFTGSLAAASRAVSQGFYFSMNVAMTKSDSGQRILTAVPPERVLTESDGPLAPVGRRPARPKDVTVVISTLAELWHLDLKATTKRIEDNFERLLTRR